MINGAIIFLLCCLIVILYEASKQAIPTMNQVRILEAATERCCMTFRIDLTTMGSQCRGGSSQWSSSYDRIERSRFSRAEQPHVLSASSATCQRACFSGSHSPLFSILVSDPLLVWRQIGNVSVVYLGFVSLDARLVRSLVLRCLNFRWSLVKRPPTRRPFKWLGSYWVIQRMSRHSTVSRIYRLMAFFVSQNVEVGILGR